MCELGKSTCDFTLCEACRDNWKESKSFLDIKAIKAYEKKIESENSKIAEEGFRLSQAFIQNQAAICYILQMFFCALLLRYSLKSTQKLYKTYPEPGIVLLRFACGFLLHNLLHGEITSGLTNMKFVINHAYRFESLSTAFLAAFCQLTSAIFIEASTAIILLSSLDESKVKGNFVALTVISQFDDFMTLGISKNIVVEVASDSKYDYLYKIKTTTSSRAQNPTANHDLHVLQDDTCKNEDGSPEDPG
jgi:hypothetical protein